MTTAQGVYSAAQRTDIPCATSEGKYCTFSLDLQNNGDFVVSFKLYELRQEGGLRPQIINRNSQIYLCNYHRRVDSR